MNNYVYDINAHLNVDRDKATYEREYAESIKILEHQKPIFGKNEAFDPNAFNRLFLEKKGKHEHQEEVQELVSSRTAYTELDTNLTSNITDLHHADYDIYNRLPLQVNKFTSEEINNAKRDKIQPVQKMSKSEIDKLIAQRNQTKFEYNTEPMKKTINQYEKVNKTEMDKLLAQRNSGGHGGASHNNGANYNEIPAPGITITQDNYHELIIQIKNHEISELKYKQEIAELQKIIKKQKKLIQKLKERRE